MIEDKIDKLNDNIEALNLILNHFWEARVDQVEHPVVVRTVKPEKSETKTETKETTVTREELHKLCLAIVRDKPNAKTKIQKVLSKRLVKDLKDDELETIKIALEKI